VSRDLPYWLFKILSNFFKYIFNPVAGGFSARVVRAFILLSRQGPKAFLRQLTTRISTKSTSSDYNNWLVYHQKSEELESVELLNLIAKTSSPLISIVMPTYNTDEKLLRLCIESVLNQSYTNWELCIADDASSSPKVSQILKEYQTKDKRIKVIFRSSNGHISAATNSALELVSGKWVALLDHDDELHRDALAFVVKVLIERPNTEFIYSDEDKIDLEGKRSDPHFKSDWNLDLLYSQNYVSHLGVYKTEIIKKIGAFRQGYEGCQDFDLLLRYSREIDHINIVHIPKVLYHWRMVEGSTALAAGEKSYTTDVGIKALQDHFDALDQNVVVEQGKHANIYKANWKLAREPLVSLIIPTYNGYEITKQAIDSILQKTTYSNYEILLVDNNSDDAIALDYFEELELNNKITVLRYPYPFNYSAINNFAVKQAKGEIIGLINNDIQVINSEWLVEMVSHAQREDIGCVGAMLYYPNDTIQHAGVIIGIGGVAGHSHKYFRRDEYGYFSRLKVVQNYSAVTAACLLVKKDIFNEVNGLNEQDLTIAFNDVDFCLKVQSAGYRNIWTPYAELYHHESISRGAEDNLEKIARFNKEMNYMLSCWKTDTINDFAYNPNLTRLKESFDLKLSSASAFRN
jgi:glycosyltransferase involved in cell wall biosynthesis